MRLATIHCSRFFHARYSTFFFLCLVPLISGCPKWWGGEDAGSGGDARVEVVGGQGSITIGDTVGGPDCTANYGGTCVMVQENPNAGNDSPIVPPVGTPTWRFQVQVDAPEIKHYNHEKQTYQISIPFQFHSLISKPEDEAHVLIGFSQVLDDRKVPGNVKTALNQTSCGRLKSCREAIPTPEIQDGFYIWNWDEDLLQPLQPYLLGISGGSNSKPLVPMPWYIEIPATIDVLGISYGFYQQEGKNGNICEINESKNVELLKGQMPFLKTVLPTGEEVKPPGCFWDRGYETFRVPKPPALGRS